MKVPYIIIENIVSIQYFINLASYVSELVWTYSQGNSKPGELVVLWGKYPDLSVCVHSRLHLL